MSEKTLRQAYVDQHQAYLEQRLSQAMNGVLRTMPADPCRAIATVLMQTEKKPANADSAASGHWDAVRWLDSLGLSGVVRTALVPEGASDSDIARVRALPHPQVRLAPLRRSERRLYLHLR